MCDPVPEPAIVTTERFSGSPTRLRQPRIVRRGTPPPPPPPPPPGGGCVTGGQSGGGHGGGTTTKRSIVSSQPMRMPGFAPGDDGTPPVPRLPNEAVAPSKVLRCPMVLGS